MWPNDASDLDMSRCRRAVLKIGGGSPHALQVAFPVGVMNQEFELLSALDRGQGERFEIGRTELIDGIQRQGARGEPLRQRHGVFVDISPDAAQWRHVRP